MFSSSSLFPPPPPPRPLNFQCQWHYRQPGHPPPSGRPWRDRVLSTRRRLGLLRRAHVSNGVAKPSLPDQTHSHMSYFCNYYSHFSLTPDLETSFTTNLVAFLLSLLAISWTDILVINWQQQQQKKCEPCLMLPMLLLAYIY